MKTMKWLIKRELCLRHGKLLLTPHDGLGSVATLKGSEQ